MVIAIQVVEFGWIRGRKVFDLPKVLREMFD